MGPPSPLALHVEHGPYDLSPSVLLHLPSHQTPDTEIETQCETYGLLPAPFSSGAGLLWRAPDAAAAHAAAQPSRSDALHAASRRFWDSGAACMSCASIVFSISALCVKLTGGRVAVAEITLVRSSLSLAASLALARQQRLNPMFGSTSSLFWLCCRGITGGRAGQASRVLLACVCRGGSGVSVWG